MWNYQQNMIGRTTNFNVVQPWQSSLILINRTTSRETVPQMARPIAWSHSQSPDQSRELSAHDYARLMVRPWTTRRTIMYDLLRPLAICNRRSRVLNMAIDLFATKFARTTTHDF